MADVRAPVSWHLKQQILGALAWPRCSNALLKASGLVSTRQRMSRGENNRRTKAAVKYLQQRELGEIWKDLGGYMKRHPGRSALLAIAAAVALFRVMR